MSDRPPFPEPYRQSVDAVLAVLGTDGRRGLSEEEARLRLEREARSISRLNHPHICTLYDFGSASPGEGEPEVPFLVMEFLDGETLAERLRGAPLSLDETLRRVILFLRETGWR